MTPKMMLTLRTDPPEYYYNGQRFYFNKGYKLAPEHEVKLMGKRVLGVERHSRKAVPFTGICRGMARHHGSKVYFVEDEATGRLCQMLRPQEVKG